MDMTSQILPFYCPEFSVVIEMTGHFFSSATGVFVRDTEKALIAILCSVHIQLHQMIKPLLIDIKS